MRINETLKDLRISALCRLLSETRHNYDEQWNIGLLFCADLTDTRQTEKMTPTSQRLIGKYLIYEIAVSNRSYSVVVDHKMHFVP